MKTETRRFVDAARRRLPTTCFVHAYLPPAPLTYAQPARKATGKAYSNGEDFRRLLSENGTDRRAVKRCYLKLAREFHPDANPADPEAAAKFVNLGKVYEKLQKGRGRWNSSGDMDYDDEGDENENDDEYGEEQARVTYSGAGGPVLTREMKRELRKIRDEMASGGARDGGWFALAAQYGDDDDARDLPGGPSYGSKPPLALESGKKRRRKKRS